MSQGCSQFYGGIWTDHSASWLNRRQFTIDQSHVPFLTASLAVIITLTGVRLWVLVSELFGLVLNRVEASLTARVHQANSLGNGILLGRSDAGDGAPGHRGAGYSIAMLPIIQRIIAIRQDKPSDIGFGLRSLNGAVKLLRDPSGKWLSIGLMLCSGLLGFVSFTGVTAGGILGANVVLSSTALCSSRSCGFHFLPKGSLVGRAEVPSQAVRYFLDNEAAAAAHESKCYGDWSSPECGNFVENTLPYSTFDNTPCPFRGDVCSLGPESAFTLDTSLLDASMLGVNSGKQYLFRRSTICAPLVTNATYIRHSDVPEGKGSVSYRYGRRRTSEDSSTFANPLKLSDTGLSSYVLYTTSQHDDYVPLPEFSSEAGKVTLIFIQVIAMFYPSKSNDPIFLADYPWPVGNKTFWMNSLNHASVLGCAEEYEICDAKTAMCWNSTLIEHEQAQSALDPAFHGTSPVSSSTRFSAEETATFLAIQLALIQSNLYNSIRMRGASALDAQFRYNDKISVALDPQQWKLELKKMFRVSLARAQVELVNIASGTWSQTAGFVDHMNPLQRRHICKMVKVRTNEKSSISFRGLVLLLFVCVVITVMSITRKEEHAQSYTFVVLVFVHHYGVMAARRANDVCWMVRRFLEKKGRTVMGLWEMLYEWFGPRIRI